MNDCIFCKIVSGEAPSHKFWENDKFMAILSIYPNTDGFSVVLSKEHQPSYAFDCEDEVLSGLILASKKVAKILDSTFEDVGRTGMFLEGFGVDHLHSKLFPMHGTGDMDEWKPIESGDSMNTFFDKYPGYLSSNSSKREDDNKLSEICERLKETAKKM